jgi:type II secretory pathway predicted ATPase ExeA
LAAGQLLAGRRFAWQFKQHSREFSTMYEAYWQLLAKPFETCADGRFYYPSEVHQGALLKLRYAVESRRGGALLAGGAGSGKTLLVHWLKRQLAENCTPFVHLVFPQMSPAELLAYVADELGATPATGAAGVDQTVRRLQNFLADNTAQGRHAVIAVDEAHLLADTGNLETLRLLTNFDTGSQLTLTLLLIGQTSILPALDRMPALEERLGVKCVLRPFSSDETASYVTHRLTAAGAAQEIFSPAALTRLHQLARGNPRRINRLCDLALLIGFAEEQSTIGPAQLEAVAGELVNVAPDA